MPVEWLAVLRAELAAEKKADSTLSELFDRVVPTPAVRNTAQCYFLLDDLLVRKWVLHNNQCIEEPVFQVVVPTKLHEKVL